MVTKRYGLVNIQKKNYSLEHYKLISFRRSKCRDSTCSTASKMPQRLSGNDHYLIKQISGHKTDIAFQRYNLVTEEEIHRIKLLDKKDDNLGTMDTYMDNRLKLIYT